MTVIGRATMLFRRARMKSVPSIMVLAMYFMLTSVAHADAVVTLCHSADDSGAGVNLRNALLATPDPNSHINTITFQCNGPATIQVLRPLEIFQGTKIDGGNTITLINTSSTHVSIIVVANPGHFLYLYNLTLRHPNSTPMNCPNWRAGGCLGSVVNAQGVTEFHHVFVDSSNIPVSITSGTLGVYDNSQFTGNSEAVIVAAEGVTTTTIDHSLFQNNPGAAPIEATGTVSISDTQFINNGATVLEACKATIQRSTFQGNATNGALQFDCYDGSISNSVFKDSVTHNVGGAIQIGANTSSISLRSDMFLNNSAFSGGAIYCFWVNKASSTRTLTVTYSTFTGNKATQGGAIFVNNSSGNAGAVTSVRVTLFSHNSATDAGGAIYGSASNLQIARGVFADNSAAGNGGAIFLSNPSPLHSILANTLFVRNHATSGSAFFGDDADFINSTIDSNVGLAISNTALHPPVHIRFVNSIVSNNPQGGCGPAGLFDDGGHNLQSGTDCGSIRQAEPHLDTMYIPLPKSPPMGNGDPLVCMAPPINGRDVYGVGRASGHNNCTIGAAEGDITVLIYRMYRPRSPKGNKEPPLSRICTGHYLDCMMSLIEGLQKLVSFVP